MDFLFYLSLLSKLFVLKVDVVYIHGDMPPKGEYWEKLKQNKRIFDRIKFITRPPPYRIYQGRDRVVLPRLDERPDQGGYHDQIWRHLHGHGCHLDQAVVV